MKSPLKYILIALTMTGLGADYAQAKEPVRLTDNHKKAVIDQVLATQNALKKTTSKPVLTLAFWDFDGTILHGDCSEGLSLDGKEVYSGLVKRSIEKGFSKIYQPEGGFEAFWKDYQYMDKRCGHWLSYPFIPQMLRGADEAAVRKLASQAFEQTFHKYYFSTSIDILNQLESNGVQNYIISASADVFVKGAANSLGLPESRFHGIELKSKHGKLTEALVYPVTYAEGKRERLQMLVDEIQRKNPDKKVVAIAAFGNSYNTDGAFMRYIAKQKLVAGKPTAVMINGGTTPESYQGVFTKVRQAKMVTAK